MDYPSRDFSKTCLTNLCPTYYLQGSAPPCFAKTPGQSALTRCFVTRYKKCEVLTLLFTRTPTQTGRLYVAMARQIPRFQHAICRFLCLFSRLMPSHKPREVWGDFICLFTGILVALSFHFTHDHVKLLLRVHHGWEVLVDPAKRHHDATRAGRCSSHCGATIGRFCKSEATFRCSRIYY